MKVLCFQALPLPHYLISGFSLSEPGRRHPERRAIGEFDLLVVKQGCMYVGEDGLAYEIKAGHALILRPDLHHYPTEGCRETTASYWLHFQTQGGWSVEGEGTSSGPGQEARPVGGTSPVKEGSCSSGRNPAFAIRLPSFCRLANPARMYEVLEQLVALERERHLEGVEWRQQLLFQEVLQQLVVSFEGQRAHPSAQIADHAASYLKRHFREPVTMREVSRELNFHPVYIARCMQKRFGCSPMEYIMQIRLDQARMLLLQTDLPIHRIAEEVGLGQPAYFTSCFRKREGVTPREFRKRFTIGGA